MKTKTNRHPRVSSQRSAIVMDEPTTVRVRVQPGWTVRARDDQAPSVGQYFFADQEIPNMDASEAVELIALGALKVI